MVSQAALNAFYGAVAARHAALANASVAKPKVAVKKPTAAKPKKATNTMSSKTGGQLVVKAPNPNMAPIAPVDAGPEVAPFLASDDLMTMADETSNYEEGVAQIDEGYKVAAIEAQRRAGDIERKRVQQASQTDDTASARGLFNSSIRDAARDRVDADAGRAIESDRSALAQRAEAGQAAKDRLRRRAEDVQRALAARAIENAAAVPRGYTAPAPAPVAAGNVKGAKTVRKTAAKKKSTQMSSKRRG